MKTLLLIIASIATPHHQHSPPVTPCDNDHVLQCIHHAAVFYHQSEADADAVASCESTDRPTVVNTREPGAPTGLFQIKYPGTWDTTPYAKRSPYEAKWSSLAAMWMWKKGRKAEWVCQ